MSKKPDPLDEFKLFYEEITDIQEVRNRLRRLRQASNN